MRKGILLTGVLFLLLASGAQAHNASATATCGSVTFSWTNFPSSGTGNGGLNSPRWRVVFFPSGGGTTFTQTGIQTFSGSSASFTEAIPEGNGHVIATSSWTKFQTRDGESGSYSTTIPISGCVAITVAKEQQIAGSGTGFTAAPLSGSPGQTVDYLIAVTNTGSAPVSLSFSDPHCDAGTIAGPSGPLTGGQLAPQTTVDYTCSHLLTSQNAPQYTNVATVVATPPAGSPVTVPSNTVVVNLPTPPGTPAKPSSPTTPISSVQGVTTSRSACIAAAGKVSSISHVGSTTRPFVVRIRAAGIAKVSFLLDGRVLKTLSHRNARGGYLSVKIDPRLLSRGTHHVTARVSLTKATCAGVARKFAFSRRAAVAPKFTG